ncbi:MAG: helix-turn-helix domain-containing protein [Erysipelotrichaceae bacterium]
MDIGKRVKQLRVKNGLTLEDLASRTELTKGFLSQLERDLTSPSISTLEDIVEVLGVSLADFFKEDINDKIVFTEQDYFVDEKEEMSITYLVTNSQKNEMEPIMLTLQPAGKSHEISPHKGQEFGYVLTGKISIINLENKTANIVKKGETFYMKGDTNHQIVNKGNSVAKVLWISTPPIF